MSFSRDTKNELARTFPEKKHCMLAEIAAFIRVSGNLRLLGGGKFEIAAELPSAATARHFNKLIKSYFGVETSVEIENGGNLKKGHNYVVTIGPEDLSEQILRETGVLMVREGANFISDGIYDGIIRTKCCRKSYLRALFLASGTMSDPEKEYHFEISCNTKTLARDIKRLFNSFDDISAKIFTRKKEQVVYVKESGQILDILAIMGAHTQYFNFEEVRFKKELRNEANRLSNCDQANIDKTLNAANRIIDCINKVGIDNMPPKLADMARVRIENPEATIKELGEKMNPPLTKAGVNGRLRRIEALAAKKEEIRG